MPGYTDDKEDLNNLGKFIKDLKFMDKFELLPYHTMALPKYENLKIKYKIKDIKSPTSNQIKDAMDAIKEGMK